GGPLRPNPRRPRLRPPTHTADLVQVRRDVFWQNVVREILLALAAAAANDTGRLSPSAAGAASSPSPTADLFDGRMGVITSLGQRIPIGDVVPVFAVSSPGTPEDRIRSNDVQCTIFRIRTPSGESYTLPITQIVGVHALSDQLADQLEQAARDMEDTDNDGNRLPFGFAAYTSLARSESELRNRSNPDQAPNAPKPDPE
ncbi:MAG: hypothetical protein D6692_09180, partial [Planctomycetota bacterium]